MPRISITVKNAIVYFLLLILTSVILGYSIYKVSSNKIVENATLSLNHNNELVLIQFKTFLDDIRKDVLFLSKDPFLYQFLDEPGNFKLKENLSKEYLALLSTKTHYLQLRLIGMEQSGKEIIRAEKFSNRIGLVDDEHLQVKGDRDYFQETVQLPKDSIYFSEINLNQEFGKIILPMVPTMRVAKSIYHNDSLYGIIIINVDLSFVFNELNKTAGNLYSLNLINSKGYFLIHPDSSKLFGFEFNKTAELDFKQGKQSIDQILAARANELFSIRTYNYPRQNEVLYFTLSASKDVLLSVFNQWKRDLFLLTAIMTLISLLIAIWWTQRQTREFKSIAQTITDFGRNPEMVNLDINRDDEIGDLVNSFKDMSGKINQHLDELKIARSEAIEANKAKSEFLENMSHEIRNPLQSILGMTGMLEQNKPRPDQQVFIDTLKFSSETLLTLVNDILDYRKLIHGQIDLNYQEVYLSDFIEKIVKSHLFDATSNKLKLNIQLDPELEQKKFQTDPVRLAQVLHNLVSNAIRHSVSYGEVILKLNRVAENQIQFSVINFGPAISLENIQNIQQQKPVTGSSRLTQNVGLGLPIVINLLKLFNSDLRIVSNAQEGTCFKFILKCNISNADPVKGVSTDQYLDFSELISVVACIDDDVQNLFYYEQLFDRFQIKTKSFHSMNEFFESKPSNFDLIITDLNFQDDLATSRISEFKKALSQNGILLLITAADDLIALSNSKGFDAVLQKPVQGAKFYRMIGEQIFIKNYSRPVFENVYANYDFEHDKIKKALELTLSEWKEMSVKLANAIKKRDTDLFDKVYHRMINTLRTFELNTFQKLLDDCRLQMNTSNYDSLTILPKINFGLKSYQQILEEEIGKMGRG